jgi:hypothetical protein
MKLAQRFRGGIPRLTLGMIVAAFVSNAELTNRRSPRQAPLQLASRLPHLQIARVGVHSNPRSEFLN